MTMITFVTFCARALRVKATARTASFICVDLFPGIAIEYYRKIRMVGKCMVPHSESMSVLRNYFMKAVAR